MSNNPLGIGFSFPKIEKLKKRKHIETLFQNGKAFSIYPYKVVYNIVPMQESSLQMGVSVSKKRFKHAVDRNKVKRLTREQWRHNKGVLYAGIPAENTLQIFFIYLGKRLPNLEELNTPMSEIAAQLLVMLNNKA